MGHRGNRRNPTEPDGAQWDTNRRALPPNTHLLFVVFCTFAPLFLPFPPSQSPIPDVSAVPKRLVLVGGRTIGSRGKASGHNGPPRNLVAPHGTWRNPAGRQKEGIWPSNPPFIFGFCTFLLSPHPFLRPPPQPNVSAVSKRPVSVGGWDIGSGNKAIGPNGRRGN